MAIVQQELINTIKEILDKNLKNKLEESNHIQQISKRFQFSVEFILNSHFKKNTSIKYKKPKTDNSFPDHLLLNASSNRKILLLDSKIYSLNTYQNKLMTGCDLFNLRKWRNKIKIFKKLYYIVGSHRENKIDKYWLIPWWEAINVESNGLASLRSYDGKIRLRNMEKTKTALFSYEDAIQCLINTEENWRECQMDAHTKEKNKLEDFKKTWQNTVNVNQ